MYQFREEVLARWQNLQKFYRLGPCSQVVKVPRKELVRIYQLRKVLLAQSPNLLKFGPCGQIIKLPRKMVLINGANKLVLPRRSGRLEAYSTKVSSSGPGWSHHQTVTKDTSADKPLRITSKKCSTISHKRSLGVESADDGRESSSK